MSYTINKQTIQFLAVLSKLQLTKDQQKRFLKQFSEVVSYISGIQKLITKKITPKFHSVNLVNVFQKPSHPKITFTQEQALKNARNAKDGMFVVPRILQEK